MTGVLIEKGKFTLDRRPCKNTERRWSFIHKVSQWLPANHQKRGGRPGRILPSQPSERTNPTSTLVLDFLLPLLGDNKSRVFVAPSLGNFAMAVPEDAYTQVHAVCQQYRWVWTWATPIPQPALHAALSHKAVHSTQAHSREPRIFCSFYIGVVVGIDWSKKLL